ncbi:(E)-4-hydroxy-3-methylbut-2-enyl-diphosphate synthase [Puniceicoccales bacterium CK1056]|uniref:4-hydroxy-3-methylbut-2-en-1-yl diphosphate synthase (flavodoxin) n=1 Tax=Oceanipulchritudo coccoides TaxID=2706888 RepID=A0A6B2M3G5_9BACT|nr:(E)-4-hydroxy-3-methylbut-2-enyl-diphosphate synthase [Oceanipulchritudo coccoides]NDV62749.1 (E)-4-hydroxy-3-methylbut-2-enyl-diphosphate synthase [Oceanipulchritudo coccoides]
MPSSTTNPLPYCQSRFQTVRRASREVRVGDIVIGGKHPLVVQSMTTTPTQDVAATVKQSIDLAEAGCEVVRITAQNVKAAEALGEIRKQFTAAGFGKTPLVADIHFLPQAAMEAVKHVEKVRINPGNYADKKKFQVKEYSDSEYDSEIQRLHESFSPIVKRCKELGRAMRIGTNHGSLSDRIMNRYGDTPLGMCESALEFIRIAESHGFHDIILSMKASNPKVMIQAYRLMVAKMLEENMHYPLHLGVTEAGDGDDARIKSAIGIGSLLYDGLGDTIRVSLTEDPVAEVPVAQALADKAMALWEESAERTSPDPVDPYTYKRRAVEEGSLGTSCKLGPLEPPLVIQPGPPPESVPSMEAYIDGLNSAQQALKDARIEGLLLKLTPELLGDLADWRNKLSGVVEFMVWDSSGLEYESSWIQSLKAGTRPGDVWMTTYTDRGEWISFCTEAAEAKARVALAISPESLTKLFPGDLDAAGSPAIVTLPDSAIVHAKPHALGRYRQLAEVVSALDSRNPVWIRNSSATSIDREKDHFGDRLLEASMLSGALLCDGIGDMISVETVPSIRQSTTLAYDILQGARTRSTKTEYVACPSCGRTLFDLQSTTQRIREATGHLKGVTIAVMGCIVNGPGEMADADFGYVGGAPGKVNLYVGKECVQYHIPAAEAVDALIALIKKHDKWTDPEQD